VSIRTLAPPSLCPAVLHAPPPPELSPLPYTTLFRSRRSIVNDPEDLVPEALEGLVLSNPLLLDLDQEHRFVTRRHPARDKVGLRSEEHTSELQSRFDLVCRLLLEKKKNESMKTVQIQ